DKEIREIRAFVENGGVLIADNSAGLMNGHCIPLATPALDSLFGIQRRKVEKGVVAEGVELTKDLGTLKSGSPLKMSGFNPAIDNVVATAYAQSKAGFPVILKKKTKKGCAYLLNMAIQQYSDDRAFGGENTKRIQNLLLALVAKAKVAPFAELRDKKNERPRFRTVRYLNGDDTYLGFVSTRAFGDKPFPVVVKLRKQYDVIDIRTGKHLGATDKINTVITPGEARLYRLASNGAAMPAFAISFSGCSIPPENKALCEAPSNGAAAVGAPGSVLNWKISTPTVSKDVRVFHVEYLDPSNKVHRWYDNVLVLPPGETTLAISRRFALNDPVGVWKLRIRETATGKVLKTPFSLEIKLLKQ
ncbi:MAG: hypothetical protein KAG97_02100, partial [Victivallales bacterium]|nr:hypothetical protein [Victivallales bacterium]